MTPTDETTRWELFAGHRKKAMVFAGAGLDPSTRIYRYLHWPRARELFRSNQLRLRSPRSWTDPYEQWWCDQLFRSGTKLYGAKPFSCCWTTRYADEPYWRMYDHSGTRDIVRVRTTVGKMLAALSSAVGAAPIPAKAYIGRVRYRPTDELTRAARDFQDGKQREIAAVAARMLHMKRLAFSLEREVRIVWIDRGAEDDERYMPFDATGVFHRVMIGPSVGATAAKSIERDLRSLGVPPTRIQRSELYRPPS